MAANGNGNGNGGGGGAGGGNGIKHAPPRSTFIRGRTGSG
jgi:hypothetical protein